METEAATPAEAPAEKETPAAVSTETETPEEPKAFDETYVKKLRAEAAKYRTEAKALAEKAKQWDEHSESQKSELEKAQEAVKKYEEELNSVKAGALRAKVAAAKGLPPALADRLRGGTEEELEADADAILETVGKPKPPSKQQTGAGVTGKTTDYENMSIPEIQKMMDERRSGSFSSRIG